MGRLQLISMFSYAKNKLQMCSVNQCRRRQRCGKFTQIHPVHSLLAVTKERFLLIEQSIGGKISTH